MPLNIFRVIVAYGIISQGLRIGVEGISAMHLSHHIYTFYSLDFFLLSTVTDAMFFVYDVMVSVLIYNEGSECRGSEVKLAMKLGWLADLILLVSVATNRIQSS